MAVWYAVLLAATLAVVVLGWKVWAPADRLEIGERGIRDRSLGWGWIPWDEVEGAYPPNVDETDSVRLRLRLTERLARVLRDRESSVVIGRPTPGSVEVRLDLADTDLSPLEVLHRVTTHFEAGEPRDLRT